MPPKKGKKGKKGGADDDDFWDQKEAAVDQKAAETAAAEANGVGGGSKGGANAFDMLDDDEDEEGGGLMGTIKASKSKKKAKKAKRAQGDADSDLEGGENGDVALTPAADTRPNMDDEWPEEDVKPNGKKGKKGGKKAVTDDLDEGVEPNESRTESPAPQPDTVVNIDDEWPEEDVKPKGKKGKKGGKKTAAKDVDEDEEEDVPAPPAEPTAPAIETKVDVVEEDGGNAAVQDEEADEADDDGPKILTKAQKEKIKKDRERAKKKAQATAKKTGAPAAAAPTAPTTVSPEEAPASAAAGKAAGKGKKMPSHIAAMQAALVEKARIEEEARKAEEERRRKIEEEEERLAAEEKRLADQKAAKKQKEKEKLAKAKAEGRVLTPAQKKEREIAEARKAAMLASGMTVAGLQTGGTDRKKPVYGKKKGKGPVKKDDTDEKEEATAEEPALDSPIDSNKEAVNGGAAVAIPANGDDWDKEEDEDAVEGLTKGVEKVKVKDDADDWDVSDTESAPPATELTKPAPTASAAPSKSSPTPGSQSKPTTSANATTKPVPPTAKPAPPKANGRAVVEEEEESEEEDSEEDDDDETDSDESSEDEMEMRKARATMRIEERHRKAEEARTKDVLRSPICTILGHVDSGKTKLLDKIRSTSVQQGEAGGITQQIGATMVPQSSLIEKTAAVNKDGAFKITIDLLMLDTPGHASFTNLRSRGSSLCDLSILNISIVDGIEPTTLESLELLRKSKTPFIVSLNKIDRMYGWEPKPNAGFRDTFDSQSKSVKSEFADRVSRIKLQFAEKGFNSELFDENKSLARNVSLVPTSAVTGEGLPDLLLLACKLTTERLNERLRFSTEPQATILDVKVIEGMGTTIDVILANGILREGDRLVMCGTEGPIVTNARALMTPPPLRETRVKSTYIHHKEVRAALGVKIYATGLEKAMAGARLYVAQDDDEVEVYKDWALRDVNDLQRYASKGPGVWVAASTLGSLEALLSFLKDGHVPIRNFSIGSVRRNHVLRTSRMLDTSPELALILAFDVQIERDAKDFAEREGVKIFQSDVIYHLFDRFKAYMDEVVEAKKKAAMPNAVWPVRLKILKAFAMRDPIVLGVDIIEGSLRVGTPVGVVKVNKETGKRDIIGLGKIVSCEVNHKPIDAVRRQNIGAGAAIKIERSINEPARMYGRHFDDKDEVVSLISRTSIDTLKNSFRDSVPIEDWAIIKKMKTEQGIP